jgi:serine/threonine-protein kinase
MFVCSECGASQASAGNCGADGTSLHPIGDDILLGTTIGAYRVARLMGVGGMGRVYKAVHPAIGSRVAIKVLSRECTDRRDLVDRFFAEAKAVNVIRHESIVNVLDLATLPDGRPYIVMEYLDGSSLAAIIAAAARSGLPLPIGGVARLCVEVLEALGAAHAKGIVHRDLKPDNIYVTPAGRAKVLDFGIAKLQPELGGSGTSTHTGSLLGTPHYMSPEQANAQPVDARADLYAMGVILFECLTLQRPFVAPSLFDLLRMHLEAPPPSVRALRRDVPEGLEHVIMAALAKQPDQRFGNAQAMSVALQHSTAQLPGDQWAPIQPAFGSRPSQPQAWVPTPPASWAGSAVRPQAQLTPTTTTAAGEVGRRPESVRDADREVVPSRSRSRSALWMGLGAVVLVGGGVAAGVLATRGNSGSSTHAPGPGSQVLAVPADAATAIAVQEPEPPAPVPPDDESLPVPIPIPIGDPLSGGAPSDVMASFDMIVGTQIDALTSAQRKELPPEVQAALEKYGKWNKIPVAERKKLADKLLGSMGLDLAALGALDGINGALSGEASPAPSPKPSTPAPSPASGKTSDGWLAYTPLEPPQPTSAGKVEAARFLTWAIAEARKRFADATLARMDVMGVRADGTTRLAEVSQGLLAYQFVVPSRIKPADHVPGAKPPPAQCAFRIFVSTQMVALVPSEEACGSKPIGSPRCTITEVWKRAIAKQAPANGLAQITYRELAGARTWSFVIRDDATGVNFSENLPDDCGAGH